MDIFFLTITWFGSLYVLCPISIILAAILWKTNRQVEILLLAGGLAGISIMVHTIKLLIARPRPQVDNLLVAMPSDYSFPSAHTAQAVVVAYSCGLIFSRYLPAKGSILLCSSLAAIALLVGISRIYLKVHYTSDVVVGALLGTIWVYFLQWLLHLPGGEG